MSFLLIVQYTDEQVQKMLELKESIIDKMAKHQEELDFLEKNLEVLDIILKNSSFTKASSLPRDEKPTQNVEIKKEDSAESIPIKKNKDGEVIANAFVTPEQISIILNEGMSLTDETPPLRTFFIERIIGEMKKTDSADVKDGKNVFVVNNAKFPQDGVIRLFLKNDSGQFWSVNSTRVTK